MEIWRPGPGWSGGGKARGEKRGEKIRGFWLGFRTLLSSKPTSSLPYPLKRDFYRRRCRIEAAEDSEVEASGDGEVTATAEKHFHRCLLVVIRRRGWHVCKILERQRFKKKLNDKQVVKILKLTCKPPHEREESIQSMLEQNNYSNDEFAREFGIKVSNKLATVEARVLPPPKKMVNGGTVRYWAAINFSNQFHLHAFLQFRSALVEKCNNNGMNIDQIPLIELRDTSPPTIEPALREVHAEAARVLDGQGIQGENIELLLIVLPDISGSYGTIKHICEIELGIVTQCFNPKEVKAKNNILRVLL